MEHSYFSSMCRAVFDDGLPVAMVYRDFGFSSVKQKLKMLESSCNPNFEANVQMRINTKQTTVVYHDKSFTPYPYIMGIPSRASPNAIWLLPLSHFA